MKNFVLLLSFLLLSCSNGTKTLPSDNSAKDPVASTPSTTDATKVVEKKIEKKEISIKEPGDDEDAPWGLPVGKNVRVLKRLAFTSGHDGKNRQPLWVAYNIKKEWVGLPKLGQRKFKPDPDLPENETALDKDYRNSGYDRGHMAPFASVRRPGNSKSEFESCYFSNVIPQAPQVNRKIWRMLEEKVREYAKKYSQVWVVSGPIFEKNSVLLKTGRLPIPTAYYKILVKMEKGKIQALAFIMDTKAKGEFSAYLVSVDAVEKATGLDFMKELPDVIEKKVESEISAKIW